jgi:hypothetical protein
VGAALALGGCTTTQPPAPFPPIAPIAGYSGAAWTPIASGMRGILDLSSPDICNRGTPSCMNAIVAEMTRRLTPLAQACSHFAPFLVMYRQVSEEVGKAVAARQYEEPGYVAHLDAVFATLYFHAYDAWTSGDRAAVPRVWQIAFSAAAGHRVSALGDLMLGMNAHISRDLPYAIAAVGLRHSNGTDGTPDVVAVNKAIMASQNPALAMVANEFDPSVAELPKLAGPLANPQIVGQVIAAWRLEAIANARKLIAARNSPSELERVQTTIDNNATVRSLLIYAATRYADPAQDTISRDRYCRAHV